MLKKLYILAISMKNMYFWYKKSQALSAVTLEISQPFWHLIAMCII